MEKENIIQLNVTNDEQGVCMEIRVSGYFRGAAIKLYGEKYDKLESEFKEALYNDVEKFIDQVNELEVEEHGANLSEERGLC